MGGGVCPLVKLTRQVFHGKGADACLFRKFGVGVVHRRLAENVLHRLGKLLLAEAFHVVPVEQPQLLQAGEIQPGLQIRQKMGGFHGVVLFLFHINTIYCHASHSYRISQYSFYFDLGNCTEILPIITLLLYNIFSGSSIF